MTGYVSVILYLLLCKKRGEEMKIIRSLFRCIVFVFVAFSLFGCTAMRQYQSGGVPEGKTFDEYILKQATRTIDNYSQTVSVNEYGVKEWSGIWLPSNLDREHGGHYTLLVIMNGNATRQDLMLKKDVITAMFPGIRIIKVEDINGTAFFPQDKMWRMSVRYKLTGRSVTGDVYDVVIPAQTQKNLVPLDHSGKVHKNVSKKRKHK